MATSYTEGFRKEIPDPTPVSVPAGFDRPVSLQELIKRYIREGIGQDINPEAESFEEADDFDVDEDPDPVSPYELQEAVPEHQDRVGPAETLDGSPSTPAEEKRLVEALKRSGGPSTDSGTVKAPAGKDEAEPS